MSISARSWSSRTWETVIAAARTRSRSSASRTAGSTWTTTSLSGSARCTAASTRSAAACPWPTAAPGETPMTTSANVRPPAWRRRSRRTTTGGSSRSIAARAATTASAGARSISTSTLRRISRTAATTTRKATNSAAIESPSGKPARAASRPPRTAMVPSEVGAEVDSVRQQRRARVAPCGAVRDERPRDVDRDHDRMRRRTPTRRARHRARSSPPGARRRGPATTSGDEDQERSLGERGEMLCLAVAVEVPLVGRLHRDADREEREQRRDEVGARVGGLGDEARGCPPRAPSRA